MAHAPMLKTFSLNRTSVIGGSATAVTGTVALKCERSRWWHNRDPYKLAPVHG